jgi:PAS domain S-box-containing protein
MDVTKTHDEFQALFNNAAIGIIIANKEGYIVLANSFALHQFGYTENELIGQKIELLIPTRFKSTHEGHRERYHTHAHSRPMGTGLELYAVKKDHTEFPVEVSLSAYKTPAGDFAIAFVSDISLRKASEEALLKLNAELEEKVADRTRSLTEALAKEMELNELKSRFVSLASHEFRTPLSTIQSSAYLISQYSETSDQSKRDKHIQRIASAVTTLTDILNDFLSVGKIEEGKILVRPSEFNIKQLTQTVIEEISPIIKKGQHINYTHSGSEKIILDSTLYKHIIMNLLTNAIKFSTDGGEIIINTIIDKDRCTVVVKDNGIGISKEDKEHLFERFFRGDNASNIQGTGLGLHIVSKYTELMNGEISCNTELNKGTEFIIQFKS